MDADSLAYACGILGLVDSEQKKGSLELLLKYILTQLILKMQKVVMMEVHLGIQNCTITLSESIKKENVKQ